MPDEDVVVGNTITTIEAEPEATAGPEADGALTDLKTEGEVGVQLEQEAQDKEPEQEAEQETEPSFEDALEAAKPLLEGLKDSDPKQYAQLTKLFGGDDVDARTVSLEQREAGIIAAAESQSAFAQVTKAYAGDQREVQEAVTSFGSAVAQTINKATQEAGGQAVSSGPRVAAKIQEYVEKAENTGRATGMADSFLEARTAALMSTLGAKLTTDELKEIGSLTWQEAVTSPRETYGKLFDTMLKAAVRAAPEEAVKQGVAKNKATKAAADVLENLVKKIPKNGKVQAAVTAPASKGAPTVSEYGAATAEQRRKWEEAGVEPIVD